jgi:hypothetical protein
VSTGKQAGGYGRRPAQAARTSRARRPLPPGQALYTPGASPARQAAERRSAPALVFLHQLPAWLPPVVLATLLICGLAVKGIIGGVALLLVAAVLGWLAVLSWPKLSVAGRGGRVLVLAAVVAGAVIQALR